MVETAIFEDILTFRPPFGIQYPPIVETEDEN